MEAKLTQADQLLLTAKELVNQGNSPFTRQVLTIAAWTKWPYTFGLEGHQLSYPDSHKVHYLLTVGRKKGGVSDTGLFTNAQGKYELTPLGMQRANQTQATVPTKRKCHDRVILAQEDQQLLLRLIDDPAHTKVRTGLQQEITPREGLGFWAVNGDVGPKVTEKVSQQAIALAEIAQLVGPDADLVLDNGLVATWGDITELFRTEQWLANRFRHHIRILERRVK